MAADRLMLVQALEAVRCLDEGILRSKADGEIGAIFGLGFAPNTGGPFAWLDRFGVASAVTILDQLTQRFGERYALSKSLRTKGREWRSLFRLGLSLRDAPHVQLQSPSISHCSRKSSSEIESPTS